MMSVVEFMIQAWEAQAAAAAAQAEEVFEVQQSAAGAGWQIEAAAAVLQ